MCLGCTAATVRLPADGYARPGRYFPVELSTDAPAPVHLSADGCLPCDVDAVGRTTVPMLAVTMPGSLQGVGPPVSLRVPADDERLIASTTELPAGVTDLFPHCRLIPIRLDPADPLPGPPTAWEVLDAVVLDPAAMAGVSDGRRSALLAGGVTLAVAGDARPDDRWPWRHRGPLWVLARDPAGPTGVVEPAAYAPTESWTPGWPSTTRHAVASAAVLIGLVTVVLTLARRTWVALGGPVAVCLIASVGVATWRAMLDPASHGGGDVTVADDTGLVQRDAWVYDRARSSADERVPWDGWTHPVFPSTASVTDRDARLVVAADGRMSYALHLRSGAAMAFVRREVRPGPPPTTVGSTGIPMRGVTSLYLSYGDRVLGDTSPATQGRWPGVAIGRP